MTIKQELIARAEKENAAYPQYKGYWNGPEWNVYRAVRDHKSRKAFRAFVKGEYILGRADKQSSEWMDVQPKGWCATSVKARDLVLVEGA